jgi:Ca2+-binding RTX toxin-like protein
VATTHCRAPAIRPIAANDTISGARRRRLLYGGRRNDLLYGGDDNDLLDGGDGDDTLYGHAGTNALRAGPGTISCMRPATIHVSGGSGNDTLTVTNVLGTT